VSCGSYSAAFTYMSGTYEISISKDIVDTVDWGPILVGPESAGLEAGSFARVGSVPFAD